jgi:acyl-CoA thioester hydrolase
MPVGRASRSAAIDAGARRGHVTPKVRFQGYQVQTAQLDGEIRDGRHRMQIRVYYEDTDFSGIVYHANYLRFMERGRSNYLRLLGADQHALFAEAETEAPGFAFVVRSMQLEFLKPARMDDVLEIVTRPLDVKGASITLGQEVRRGELLLLEAKVKVAFVCDGRAKPIPKALRMAMNG